MQSSTTCNNNNPWAALYARKWNYDILRFTYTHWICRYTCIQCRLTISEHTKNGKEKCSGYQLSQICFVCKKYLSFQWSWQSPSSSGWLSMRHQPQWVNVQVLARVDQLWDRVIIKSLLIQLAPGAINKDKGLARSSNWRPLIWRLNKMGRLVSRWLDIPPVRIKHDFYI